MEYRVYPLSVPGRGIRSCTVLHYIAYLKVHPRFEPTRRCPAMARGFLLLETNTTAANECYAILCSALLSVSFPCRRLFRVRYSWRWRRSCAQLAALAEGCEDTVAGRDVQRVRILASNLFVSCSDALQPAVTFSLYSSTA